MPRPGYGPVQLRERLGWREWQFERARAENLVPPPNMVVSVGPGRGTGRRWSDDVVAGLAARVGALTAQLGRYPDVGAVRAAEILAGRLGVRVEPHAVADLSRAGRIPKVGEYEGRPLYCGRALETFTDTAAIATANEDGELFIADAAAAFLDVRRGDLGALVKRGWLAPAEMGDNSYRSKKSGAGTVALYRRGDLVALAESDAIDWAAVRAVPAGKRSLLLGLPDRSAAAGVSR
jgi:hypothetical protein